MPTKYQAERQASAELATNKAKIHGRSTWPFTYRGQQVLVTATKTGSKIRLHTDNVKNKSK